MPRAPAHDAIILDSRPEMAHGVVMLLSRAIAVVVVVVVVVVVPTSGCAARATIDDVIRLVSSGETLADDALRTARAGAEQLATSEEAQLVCKASAAVAGAALDDWSPQVTQDALLGLPATTEAGTKLRQLVDSAVANPETKSGIKVSITAFDAAYC